MADNRLSFEEEQIMLLRKQLFISRMIALLLGIIALVSVVAGVILAANISGLVDDLQQTVKTFNESVLPALKNLDIDSLNEAIENLNEAVKPLSGLFGR